MLNTSCMFVTFFEAYIKYNVNHAKLYHHKAKQKHLFKPFKKKVQNQARMQLFTALDDILVKPYFSKTAIPFLFFYQPHNQEKEDIR